MVNVEEYDYHWIIMDTLKFQLKEARINKDNKFAESMWRHLIKLQKAHIKKLRD